MADGFEKDPAFAPVHEVIERIQAIDLRVTSMAGKTLIQSAPDLSWVYSQTTDDIGYHDGDSREMDLAAHWVDACVSRRLSAVQARSQQFENEDWLVMATTYHGRDSLHGKRHS